jgi:hypothetical protein
VSASGYTGNPPGSGGGGGASSWSEITGKPSTFPPSTHSHAVADVSGLQAALDAKAAQAHTHAISAVTGLQDALDAKAAASHTHAISAVTGLQAALDGKQAAGSYAAASHTHAISGVTGLQTALDGKAPVVMAWNGSAYVATPTATVYVGPSDPGTVPDGSVWIDTTP